MPDPSAPPLQRGQPGHPRRGMLPADLYRLSWLSDAQVRADGASVAFVVTTLCEQDDDYRSTIWVVPAQGGEARPFTRGARRDSSPRWSPDGRWLAFVSERDGEKGQLFIIPADGGEAKRLTSLKLGVSNPVWSPDSRTVCVAAKELVAEEIAPEEGTKRAPPPRIITTLKYKLNAEGFTYDKRRHLHLVDVEAGTCRQLTFGDFDDGDAAWSPDGNRLTFVSARHEDRDFDKFSDLFTVEASGGEPFQITDTRFTVSVPAWSPDGETIAFAGHDHPSDPPRHSRLWTIAASGGEPCCLTEGYDRDLTTSGSGGPSPRWSSDSRRVYCGAHDRGDTSIVAVNATAGAVETVVGGERTVGSFSISSTGDLLVFTASKANRPPEVFVRDLSGERRLTDFNDQLLEELDLVQPERFLVRRPDGFEIDAWLMHPAGYRPGTAYPLLVNMHGGPFGQYGATFLDEFQVQAGGGFGVLYCNPRGSSGRDEEFARSIIGVAGIPDSEDVLAALDQALASFADIDRNRLGILGGSYGGYLTSWIIGHTDRFAAACSERGVNNRLSKAGTDDLNTTATYFRAEPYDDPDLFLKLSPMMYARSITTPLLIMHSEEDLRCPMEQAEQMYTALKRLRRDVVLVRFPGENHELSRAGKPSHRVARFEIQLDFFRSRMRIPAP
ncbi:MAG: S9 family peptidase [Dehalococcoidia bacterium]